MARRSADDEKAEQLNVKLPARRYEILKAAAFVRGEPNLRELVMPVLDRFIDELEADEAVKLALRARQVEAARADGVLTQLRGRGASAD